MRLCWNEYSPFFELVSQCVNLSFLQQQDFKVHHLDENAVVNTVHQARWPPINIQSWDVKKCVRLSMLGPILLRFKRGCRLNELHNKILSWGRLGTYICLIKNGDLINESYSTWRDKTQHYKKSLTLRMNVSERGVPTWTKDSSWKLLMHILQGRWQLEPWNIPVTHPAKSFSSAIMKASRGCTNVTESGVHSE